jgi:hypothetical protein
MRPVGQERSFDSLRSLRISPAGSDARKTAQDAHWRARETPALPQTALRVSLTLLLLRSRFCRLIRNYSNGSQYTAENE